MNLKNRGHYPRPPFSWRNHGCTRNTYTKSTKCAPLYRCIQRKQCRWWPSIHTWMWWPA